MVVVVGGAQAYRGPEGKSGEDDWQLKFAFKPFESGSHVVDFADAVCMLSFAQAGTTEVEAQDGKSEAVERFHGVEDDLVMERSSVERMRMADQRRVRGRGRAIVEQGLEASGGAVEKE